MVIPPRRLPLCVSVSPCLRAFPSASRPAFALADVIVGTVILGSALAVVVGLAGRAVTSQAQGEELAAAASLADEQLQLVLARGPDDYPRRFPVQGVCDSPFDRYRYAIAFSGGASLAEPYKVTATISWTSGSTPRTLTIDTLMSSRAGNPDADPDPIRTPPETINRTP